MDIFTFLLALFIILILLLIFVPLIMRANYRRSMRLADKMYDMGIGAIIRVEMLNGERFSGYIYAVRKKVLVVLLLERCRPTNIKKKVRHADIKIVC